MKNRTDLNLCKVVYISEFYHMADSLIDLLNGFDFIFDGVTCASHQYYSGTPLYYHSVNQPPRYYDHIFTEEGDLGKSSVSTIKRLRFIGN